MMIEKIQPLYDRILVQRSESEQTTAAGIIIPDTAQEKTQAGKVNADGSLRVLKVKAGDKILFGKYSGTEIKLNGEELLILKEDEVLAIIK